MNINDFITSLSHDHAPAGISSYLQSLWHDGKGNWEAAHIVVQDIEDKTAAWIHAYLHRKEGDNGNARYWYNKAGKEMPQVSLEEEWKKIVSSLLKER